MSASTVCLISLRLFPYKPYLFEIGNGSRLTFVTFSLPSFPFQKQISSGQALLDEVANAQRVSVSDVASPAQARFCESAEASHSSHDVTGAIAKGTPRQLTPFQSLYLSLVAIETYGGVLGTCHPLIDPY